MSRNRNPSDPLTKQSSISSISSYVPLVTSLNDDEHRKSSTDLQNRDGKRARNVCQPKGTIPYTVTNHDTLEKIALHFNLTPSELLHLNKLNSRIVFPGQILFVPESVQSDSSPIHSTNLSPPISWNKAKEGDAFILLSDRRLSGGESSSPPSFQTHQQDVGPMVWSMSRQSAAKPGHVERLKSQTSVESDSSARTIEERLRTQVEDNTKQVRQIQKSLSIDENRALDEECLQRFLKVNVQLVTDDHKKVSGTLLVTPNAVMFDPDVLDPAVKEHGIEKYGLIIRMDLLAGVAMYEDIGLYDHEVTSRDEEKRRLCHSTSIKSLRQPSITLLDLDEEQVRQVMGSMLDQLEHREEERSSSASNATLKLFNVSSPTHFEHRDELLQPLNEYKHSIGILFHEPEETLPRKSQLSLSAFLHAIDLQKEFQLEDCVSLGDINRRFGEIDKLLQKQHEMYISPHPIEIPYYLCLKTSRHIPEKKNSSTRPHSVTPTMDDVYGKKELELEYWFSVPKEKVDHLYAFFLRWTPERDSDASETNKSDHSISTSQSSSHSQKKSNEKLPSAKGFVLLSPDEAESTEDYLFNENKTNQQLTRQRTSTSSSTDTQKEQKKSHYLKRQNTLLKEWEVINVEEIYRRINAAQANHAHLEDISAIPAPNLLQPSTIINEQQSKEILLELPARVHGLNWQLVFSTEAHGFSLNQLYRRGIDSDLDTPALLIVRDVDQNIFGAYVSQQFMVSEGFYGTGESFLFAFYPEFQAFKWTGHNQFFVKGDVKALGIGCGEGIFGLWLDADLYHGRTCPSKTFDNTRLTSKEDFIIASVEVWSFVD